MGFFPFVIGVLELVPEGNVIDHVLSLPTACECQRVTVNAIRYTNPWCEPRFEFAIPVIQQVVFL